MMSRNRVNRGRLVFGVGVIALICAIAIWQIVHLKISSSTRDKVMAVIPADLLVSVPDDPASKARFDRAFESLQAVDRLLKRVGYKYRISHAALHPISKKIGESAETAQLIEALNLGSFAYDPKKAFPNESAEQISFANLIGRVSAAARVSASAQAEEGNYDLSYRLFKLSMDVGTRFENMGESIRAFRDKAFGVSAVYQEIGKVAVDPKTPVAFCERILSLVPPAENEDSHLLQAIRTDFQRITLEILPDPRKWVSSHPDREAGSNWLNGRVPEYLLGKYDAVKTAKRIAWITEIQMKNARSPYNRIDYTPDSLSFMAFMSTPQKVEDSFPPSLRPLVQTERWVVALAKNQNVIENWMISSMGFSQDLVVNSCSTRAIQDSARVALASRLYRSSHAGNLPTSTTAFLPYLRSKWPIDPFDGKPMRYNRAKQVVYSVGQNCKDDGGNVDLKVGFNRDCGLSLALGKSKD